MRALVVVVSALLGLVASVVATYLFGFRTKNRTILRGVRRINHVALNPRQMKSAGTAGSYASIVRHVGRTSGRSYETPIVVRELDDRFVVVLPYGTQADWVRNVLAGGPAEIVSEDRTWRVSDPQLVGVDDVEAAIQKKERGQHDLFGITDALVLDRVLVDAEAVS